ncbi:hypothetical protein EV426DRAFT_702095 [Tirmania nivea]|nr:hypothetical protein EV426DRAFT_702095 [Tirmania nivea]
MYVLRKRQDPLRGVKAHVGIPGNERADVLAKEGAEKPYPEEPQITEGGLRQEWKRMREAERKVAGTGGGRVVRWGRKARLNYVHCRTGKGNLQSWRAKLDDTVDPTCRTCGRHVETGGHVALVCPRGEEIGRRWSNWEEMDERKKWAKKVKDGGEVYMPGATRTAGMSLGTQNVLCETPSPPVAMPSVASQKTVPQQISASCGTTEGVRKGEGLEKEGRGQEGDDEEEEMKEGNTDMSFA